MDQNCEGWGTDIWRTVDKWTECRSLSIFLHITLFFASLRNHLVIGFTSINNINKLPRFLLRDRLKVFYPNPTAAFWMLLIAPVVNFYKIRSRVIKNLSASWLMRSFNTYIFVEKWCAVGVWCVRSLRMRRKYWSFKENCLVGSWLFSCVRVCGFFFALPCPCCQCLQWTLLICSLMFASNCLPVPERSSHTRPEPVVRHNWPQTSFSEIDERYPLDATIYLLL